MAERKCQEEVPLGAAFHQSRLRVSVLIPPAFSFPREIAQRPVVSPTSQIPYRIKPQLPTVVAELITHPDCLLAILSPRHHLSTSPPHSPTEVPPHLPSQLLALESLSRGLSLGEPKRRQHLCSNLFLMKQSEVSKRALNPLSASICFFLLPRGFAVLQRRCL